MLLLNYYFYFSCPPFSLTMRLATLSFNYNFYSRVTQKFACDLICLLGLISLGKRNIFSFSAGEAVVALVVQFCGHWIEHFVAIGQDCLQAVAYVGQD
jgi:hypothetical protein